MQNSNERSELETMPVQEIHDQLVRLRSHAHRHNMGFSGHIIDVAIESVIRESGLFSWDQVNHEKPEAKVVQLR